MRRLARTAGGLALALAVTGCAHGPRRPYDADPQLAHTPPVVGKPVRTAASPAAAEPAPPPRPPETGVRIEPPPLPPVPVPKPFEARPDGRPGVEGTFGRADDFRWLQGRIDRRYGGRTFLRYRDPAERDEWGGLVLLPDDPQLAAFRDGEVVYVEGELPETVVPAGGIDGDCPKYFVRRVWAVK